jgi:hypothetical protein
MFVGYKLRICAVGIKNQTQINEVYNHLFIVCNLLVLLHAFVHNGDG